MTSDQKKAAKVRCPRPYPYPYPHPYPYPYSYPYPYPSSTKRIEEWKQRSRQGLG